MISGRYSFIKKFVYHEINPFRGVSWKTPRNKWTALKRKSSFPVGNFSGRKAWSLFEFLQGFLNLRLFTGDICAAILNFGERGERPPWKNIRRGRNKTREHSQNITLQKLSSFPTQQLMHEGGMTFCKASQHSPSLSDIKFAFPPRTFQKSLVSPPSETSLAL